MVVIAAGPDEGLHTGEILRVVRPGKRISPREGLTLELPADDVARLEVMTSFSTARGEIGTACAIISGDSIAPTDRVLKDQEE